MGPKLSSSFKAAQTFSCLEILAHNEPSMLFSTGPASTCPMVSNHFCIVDRHNDCNGSVELFSTFSRTGNICSAI